ncbi:asparagine synthase (glutamine-hydrolyzing) [Fodinisporobacter ferrooxydans]|uniref:asparagine synthase (glutamine-hydrolyzing) n=1 Tax=Fodinisporobacter ferrooxydans TaxID=2901836 RepID=A0ABY4CMJ5_9BACL|nr:asparagine synthase (glutamine-hydrolyzing) [Alicyclobacillaceae bacterium MYW30-H2]
MCGIAGWIDWDADLTTQETILQRMADTLKDRGPDASGFWASRTCALAHRRLAVIDIEGGRQPMIRQFGGNTYVIVYNGELYNTEDIRKELLLLGHTFRGHSDTEVLLTAFIEWGPVCVDRLNGIFAFGIWNERDQQLFLCRDRLGVKPLFYSIRGSSLIFGSELKTMLAHPKIPAEIDEEGLAEIFSIGPSRTPGHGVFRNVSELKPGYFMMYNRDRVKTEQYWIMESLPHTDDVETTTEKVKELFRDTVERQLISDVPICTLLSGGLDSSAITALAAEYYQRIGSEPLHTFSVDYVDNDIHFKPNQFQPNPDAPFIDRVTEYLGTVKHDIKFDTPELIESLKMAVFARDLPGMTDVDSSLLLFCREIKKEATVALSGECADEVFGGYPWFHREDALHATIFPWSRNLKDRVRLLSPEVIKKSKPEEYVQTRYQEALAEVPRLEGETGKDARIREMFYLNLTRWMPTLLDRKDRMSMYSGLEVRVPFCDHRLVEYVWNIPWEMKTVDQQAKGILRRALRGHLPDDVLYRRKSPYPKTHNPSYLAACREWLRSILDDPTSPVLEFINVKEIRNIMELSYGELDFPWFGQLMNVPALFAYLAQVDTWMREYKVKVV